MPEEDKKRSASQTKPRVLIIDGDGGLRRRLAEHFEKRGLASEGTGDGESGLVRFREDPPDVVVVDLGVRGVDGMGVLRHVVRERPETPVIMLSSSGVIADAIVAQRSGAWDYILKPVPEPDIVFIAIDRALERARLVEENRRYREHLQQEVKRRTAELEAANHALRDSEERLRFAVGQMPGAMWATDAELRVHLALGRALGTFGAGDDELPAPLEGFLPRAAGKPGLHEMHAAALAGEQIHAAHEVDGGHYEIHCEPFRDEGGHIIGVLGLALDVTERRRAEEAARLNQQQLIQADKMASLGVLVAGVAHEINNPNQFVMSNMTLLSEAWEGMRPVMDRYYQENGDFLVGSMRYSALREELGGMLDDMKAGSQRIRRIVQELRDFALQSPSDLTEAVDINAVVKSAATLLGSMVRKATRHFTVRYGEDLPKLDAHFQRLEQVTINIIQNACQALASKEDAIEVTTRYDPAEEEVVLEVRDEGLGMPADVAARVTDPFFTTKREAGGTGLGLSISSSIVSDHGGTLDIESEEGLGTCVRVRLPLAGQRNGTGGPV